MNMRALIFWTLICVSVLPGCCSSAGRYPGFATLVPVEPLGNSSEQFDTTMDGFSSKIFGVPPGTKVTSRRIPVQKHEIRISHDYHDELIGEVVGDMLLSLYENADGSESCVATFSCKQTVNGYLNYSIALPPGFPGTSPDQPHLFAYLMSGNNTMDSMDVGVTQITCEQQTGSYLVMQTIPVFLFNDRSLQTKILGSPTGWIKCNREELNTTSPTK